jgi:hypothetical protein
MNAKMVQHYMRGGLSGLGDTLDLTTNGVNLLDPNSTNPAGYGVFAADVPAAQADLSTVAPAAPSSAQAEPGFPWKGVLLGFGGLLAVVTLGELNEKRRNRKEASGLGAIRVKVPSMTKQHFEYLANLLAESEASELVVRRVAKSLKESNSRFDEKRFIDAVKAFA